MADLVNNSGQGKGTPVVDVVAKRFNWGAFFFTWIWGLCNNTYITLLYIPITIAAYILLVALIATLHPILGILIYIVLLLGCQIWFGIKGNTWAWQNKKFTSLEHFHDNQKIWAIVGAVLTVLPLVISAMTIPTLITNTSNAQARTMRMKIISTATDAAMINEALENKCNLSSNGLAKCFAKQLIITNTDNNILTLSDSTVWKFNGDKMCIQSGDCSIDVEYKGEALITIPLMKKKNGYIVPDSEKLEKYIK